MNLQRLQKLLTALVVIVFLMVGLVASVSAETAEDNELIELKVLHTNDIHAKINDFGKIAAYIQTERAAAEYSIYLDAGDIFSGNPVVDLQFGEPIIDLFNDMGLQAMAIGNHDFDYGQEETVKRIAESNFPWLSANTIVGSDTEVDFPQPEPFHIFDVNGLTVGVFSLTETPPATAPANVVGISFEDPIETAKQYEYLQEETDVLIALTHIGYSEDQKLAQEVDFFDVIIGGHSHTTLSQPNVVNGTPIVQTGGDAANIGNLSIHYNPETDEVESVEGFLQRVSDLTETDADIQAKVDQYNNEMDELLSEEIGYTDTGLSRNGSLDTALGNFWTDAMRFKTDSDIALTNNGGIRANIATGPITVNDIYTIEPFANEIMKYEMTGAAIKDVIQYSYERDDRNRIDLQTSGLHYKIITNNAGKYMDADLEVNGEPVEEDKTYVVAVGDYIGLGGSGYNFEGEVLEALTGMMTDAMITYAKHLTENGEKINYAGNERISIEVSNEAPIEGEEIGSTENGLSAENSDVGDSGLGNLYTDAVRQITGADFGILNGSSVTGNIPAGIITDSQIEFLDQFGNEIMVVKTTADQLKEVILTQSNYYSSVDLQVSGLHYKLIKENNQFVDVELTLPDGSPLEDSKEYVVAYNDYMHGTTFYNLGSETISGDFGPVWVAVVEYVRNHDGAIDYQEGSRITITDITPDPPTDADYLTVAQAIANNEGTKTVRGYIVGTMTGNFDGDYATTNLMLADSPDERNMDNILPVQLPNNTIRSQLNLVDNPDNLGKLIQITGDLEAYFSRPGLRSPTSFEFIGDEEEPVPTEPSEPIGISEARNTEDGQKVTIEGIVTTNTGNWGGKGFYLQDNTAGIYVFQNDLDLKAGDVVRLTGEKGTYNGEVQISSLTKIEKLGEENVPAPINVTPSQISLENESQLVQIEEAVISELEEVNEYGTFEFIATVDGESVLVRVDNRTGLTFAGFEFANGDVVSITGISSQFNGTIQLKPRSENDIVLFEQDQEDEIPEVEDPIENEDDNESDRDEETQKQDHVHADVVITDQIATISDESVERLADNGTLTIDVTEMESAIVQVDITSDQLADLVQKNAVIEIVKEQEVTLRVPAVNFTNNHQLSIILEKLDDPNPISAVYDFTILDGADIISEFEEAVTLVFPVNRDEVDDTEALQIFFLNEQGEWEAIGGEYQEGFVIGTTNHFSTFTVLEAEDILEPEDPKDPEAPQNPKEQQSDNDGDLGTDQPKKDETKETTKFGNGSEEGHSLPETSTSTFNWLMAGLLILVIGAMMLMVIRNKKAE